MTEEVIVPKRDKVQDWRRTECLRIIGDPVIAGEFAESKYDLHQLERMARSGASASDLKEWLL